MAAKRTLRALLGRAITRSGKETKRIHLEIGEAAGKVWHFLSKNPHATFDDIYKSLSIEPRLFCMAVGWLAREDKIEIDGQGKKRTFALKRHANGSAA
jgi:hypothetical protein